MGFTKEAARSWGSVSTTKYQGTARNTVAGASGDVELGWPHPFLICAKRSGKTSPGFKRRVKTCTDKIAFIWLAINQALARPHEGEISPAVLWWFYARKREICAP